MTRRQLLLAALAPKSTRPNIIMAMADDLGWGDVSFHGHKILKTPHLDAMAAAGLRMDRFYAGAPVCSPTRGSCLTGRHPYRYGIFFANADDGTTAPSKYSLPREEITIAEALKPLGYRTAHMGKWHLGDFDGPKRSAPSDNGFDEYFSTVRKVRTLDPEGYFDNGKLLPGLKGDDSKILVDRALEFIRRASAAGEPFLLVLWFHTPHVPVIADAEHRARFTQYSEKQQHYWGAITAMDEQMGRLRAELRGLKIADNTMLWWASDNGPEGNEEDANNPGTAGPWRGRKRSLFEGGVRVPAMLEWPARVKAGRRTDAVCSTLDYFPTILDLVGVKPADPKRPIDGISLRPLIEERPFASSSAMRISMKERPTPVAFETMGDARGSLHLALIENRYKLITDLDEKADMLFDLAGDAAESTNLAPKMPVRVKAMRARLSAWRDSCRASNAGKDYGS